jgi:hypothetical protein
MPADTSALKAKVLDLLERGKTVAEAMAAVKRHERTYDYWRKTDESFADSVRHIRELQARTNTKATKREVPDFDVFCRDYLHQPLHFHQLQWFDLLEGREPRDLHPSETYSAGEPEKILVNTPVEHAKSTTLTVNYVVWRICQDPNVRVLIVSKTREMAKKFLYAIKNRLSHPAFRELQIAFAPEGGWKASAEAWTTEMIYVGAEDRTSGEKDPTVQALGIRGHIYGARADLIIVDDGVALDNAHEYEKQIEWLEAEVETRLSGSGMLMIVGTRIAPQDLYGELENPERYVDGVSPWTRLVQPAVLEFADDPADWVTLWPMSQAPCKCRQFCNKGDIDADENGLYPKWDGRHLNKIRKAKSPRTWAMVYMQQQVLDDAVFLAAAVRASIDGARRPGPMVAGAVGHREHGMEGCYVVAGLDPAMAENTAAVVMAVDRTTKRRWVLDVFDRKGVTPTEMRNLIKDWTVKFSIHEWRIEKNAFQIMLTQDEEIRNFLASRGCLLREHYTGKNKWDGDFGVASMALLFGTVTRTTTGRGGYIEKVEGGLIGLPSTNDSEACKRLVEQLITWQPDMKGKLKTDIVMALWFAEIRAREIANHAQGVNHLPNKFLGRRARNQRAVINLDAMFQSMQDDVIRV